MLRGCPFFLCAADMLLLLSLLAAMGISIVADADAAGFDGPYSVRIVAATLQGTSSLCRTNLCSFACGARQPRIHSGGREPWAGGTAMINNVPFQFTFS